MLPVLDEEPLVDVRRLLEVAPQVLDRGEAELVLLGVREGLVLRHHRALVVPLVGRVEEDARLQSAVRRLLGLLLCLAVLGKRVQAARL